MKASWVKMPPTHRAPAPERPGALPMFFAGSAVGFLLAAFLAPRRGREDGGEPRVLAGGLAQLALAWEDALEAWTAMLPERAPLPLDLAALAERIRALPGGEAVQLAVLDSGIVEVTGEVADDSEARELIEEIGAAPGVRIVLNRIWLRSALPPSAHGKAGNGRTPSDEVRVPASRPRIDDLDAVG